MADSKSPLVEAFESAGKIANRYSNLYCVNYRPGDTHKRDGQFSLVFRADDEISGQPVSIKIMDPDYLANIYRLSCFDREPVILKSLQSHTRCLRLIEGCSIFQIDVSISPVHKVTYPVRFFVTEWLEEDIERYFYDQQNFDALIKLQIYRLIILSVKALHDQDACHRDLKRNNLRVRVSAPDKPVIAIDFGTSAKLDTPHALASYGDPVGHQGYAPPEAFAGLAGVRQLGKLTDAYALGAILYELFMPDLFFSETIKNPVFRAVLNAALHKVSLEPDIDKRLELWKVIIRDFARAVQPPSIVDPGSSVPVSVRQLIAEMYSEMTAFDLSKRLSNLDIVLRRIDGVIRCISNQILWDKEQAKRRKAREDRLQKAKEKEARISARHQAHPVTKS